MQNTFSQSGNDSKWFLKKSFFKIGMWHSRPPRDPPPLHGKCHLKFPFWLFEPFPNANIRQLPENAGEHLKFWEGCGYILCLHLPAMICTTIGPRSIEISFSKKIHVHTNSTSSTQPVGQSRSVYIQQLLQFDDYKLRSSPKFSVQTDKRLLLTTDWSIS